MRRSECSTGWGGGRGAVVVGSGLDFAAVSWGLESRVVGCLLPEKGREVRDSNEGSGKQLGIPAPESFGVLSGKDMISASLSLWSSTDILQRVRKPGTDCGGAPQFTCKMQAVNHSSPLGLGNHPAPPRPPPHRPPPSPLRAAELKGREHISATGRILNTTGESRDWSKYTL